MEFFSQDLLPSPHARNVLPVLPVPQDPLDLKVSLDLKENLDFPERMENPECLVPPDLKDLPDPLESPETKDLPENPDRRSMELHQDLLVLLAPLDLKDLPDLLARMAAPENLDPSDLPETQERKVNSFNCEVESHVQSFRI